MSGFTANDVPDSNGKCIIVTGANTGLGFEAARVLARRRARVLLACRDEAKAQAAIARIRAETPGADLAFLPCDQADLASVRRAAEIAAQEPRIDVLLNNAGVMFPPLTRTAQGFELQFGVNHLGCFALTCLMLPKLAQTHSDQNGGGARVVVTASLAHTRGNIDWDDLNAEKSYKASQRYGDSKLANLLFVQELDRRLRAAHSPVTAVACHPGVAGTDFCRVTCPQSGVWCGRCSALCSIRPPKARGRRCRRRPRPRLRRAAIMARSNGAVRAGHRGSRNEPDRPGIPPWRAACGMFRYR